MFNLNFIRIILGRLLYFIASFLFIPLIVSIIYREGNFTVYITLIILLFVSGLILIHWNSKWNNNKNDLMKIRLQDLFLATSIVWCFISIVFTLPYILISNFNVTDAIFETVSGITTTGSTLITKLSDLPHSIIIWRSISQWIGGIGFIVISISIFPNANIGGMGLFKMESSDKSEKAFAHSRDVAKSISILYLVLTILCLLSFYLSGMKVWDAINMTLTTVSTGGFAPTDSGFSLYSDTSQWIGVLFMILSSLPMVMIVGNIYTKQFTKIITNSQLLFFLGLITIFSLAGSSWLYFNNTFSSFYESFKSMTFNVVNLISTAGFTNGVFDSWTYFTTFIFIICFIIGGCSGSTSGGLKVFRLQLLFKFIKHQLTNTIHTNNVNPIYYDGKPINNSTMLSIFTFISIYLISLIVVTIILTMYDLNLETSLSAALSSLSNIGPGIGSIIGPSGSFKDLPEGVKIILSFTMLLGRLEMTTLIILLLPKFWRY